MAYMIWQATSPNGVRTGGRAMVTMVETDTAGGGIGTTILMDSGLLAVGKNQIRMEGGRQSDSDVCQNPPPTDFNLCSNIV